jgi:hypothetical protein
MMFACLRCIPIGIVAVMLTLVAPAFGQDVPEHGAPSATASPEPTREQLKLQVNILKDYIANLKDNAEKQAAELRANIEQLKADLAAATPAPDPVLENAEKSAKLRELQYAKEKFDIAVDGYWEQRINSRVALVLLVLMVLAGIAFSAYQLWKSAHSVPIAPPSNGNAGAAPRTRGAGMKGQAAQAPEVTTNATTASDLEISAGKIRITSTVIGVLVLIISLAFFYIYMKELTSIRVVGDLGSAKKHTNVREPATNGAGVRSNVEAAPQ